MTIYSQTSSIDMSLHTDLSRFCQDLFCTFARSDQRRWGEVYVRGLTDVRGRKSVRRISEHVLGERADQNLQQFVNQSPWEWGPVRSRLAQHVSAMLRPRLWVAKEVIFPKNGASSVGVAKQYVDTWGRTLNCQVGLALFVAGDLGSCPVNWKLQLPRSWNDDLERRKRTHLPDEERHRPRWSHLLDAVDEMALDWDLTPPPILVDARHERNTEPLLAGLEERGLHYLVRVKDGTPLVARRGGPALAWHKGRAEMPGRARFVLAPLAPARTPVNRPPRPHPGPRRVLAEWPSSQPSPTDLWLTNLNPSRLQSLTDLIRLSRRTSTDLTVMKEELGLQHFEGRSFRGWHHHVTLVSVAHGHRLLQGLAEDALAERRRPRSA
ncbi:IS701 family transposase [Actinomadura barringtoniae]|uniref:IS701 family transposase n=1 Tax=Actinomadura barringtoniae TaxID=1427535 RepID=A0A939PAV2_9ACTN|nr:IS701 family transposase [Actinomadura barringtoniae]MBO2448772.1 IS701 family transposase [Actinomadura barringtoniae]